MTDTTCPTCDADFSSEKSVRDHSWDAHGRCHHCGDGFDDREGPYSHWLADHDADLSREARKRAESKVGTRTVCPGCGDRFASDDAVRDHAWDAHGICYICGDRFDEEATLYTQWLAAHENDLPRSTRKRASSEVGAPTFTDRLSHQGPSGAIGGVSVSRRTLLGGGAAGLILAVGGVVANGVISGGGGGSGGGGSGGGGGGATGTSLAVHPATGALESQPTRGPPPSEADGTIVAFEDPS